ncbi:hypothetical protein [Isoptericola cucumis]|uniref:Uncharacterized protein n=1 Tax=Isoptericola cucumis TaxID=1776856 RepID=A0ABQ2B8M7_9MICO|nr:hypothetical protein [Isoptericola cucumis]GGI09306.1 hypothetical protein GCM10007368_25510 [Isoptericola cucumis]
MSDFIEWGALGQVLVAGLIVGAGIPALFALGLRLLAGTTTEQAPAAPGAPAAGERPASAGAVSIGRPTPARLAGAIVCLGVVVGAVAFGLVFLVSGGH